VKHVLDIIALDKPETESRLFVANHLELLAQDRSQMEIRFFYGLILVSEPHLWGLSFDLPRAEEFWATVEIESVRDLVTKNQSLVSALGFFFRQRMRATQNHFELIELLRDYYSWLKYNIVDLPLSSILLIQIDNYPF
jgi:hypothetical protein